MLPLNLIPPPSKLHRRPLERLPPFSSPNYSNGHLFSPPLFCSPFFTNCKPPYNCIWLQGQGWGGKNHPRVRNMANQAVDWWSNGFGVRNRMWLDWFNGWFHLMDEHWSESIFRLSQSVRLLKTVNQNLIHSCMIPWYMWKLIQFQLFHSFLSQYKCFLFSLMVKTCIYRC